MTTYSEKLVFDLDLKRSHIIYMPSQYARAVFDDLPNQTRQKNIYYVYPISQSACPNVTIHEWIFIKYVMGSITRI